MLIIINIWDVCNEEYDLHANMDYMKYDSGHFNDVW
jgi:hypothetical protein